MLLEATFKQIHDALVLVFADDISETLLILDQLFLFLLLFILIFGRDFPIYLTVRLIVSVIVTDLEKDEPTIFILQKVTDEQVERAFCLRINVLLREDLVEFVDRLKHSRVRIRHTFHNDAAFFVVGIHSEDVVEEVGSESLLHARHKLFMCLFVIFECRLALLRLCCIIPLL